MADAIWILHFLWEFSLRKKIYPHLDYDYSYTSYYTYKLTHRRLSSHFISRAAIVFLVASIALNFFFQYVLV